MNPLSWLYAARSHVDTFAHLVTARWLLGLIWALALAAMTWFYGDTIALGSWRPLDSVEHRLIAIGVILAAWVAYVVWLAARQRRANAAIIAELGAETGASQGSRSGAQEEVAELRARLRHALATMRKAVGGGRGYVYKL